MKILLFANREKDMQKGNKVPLSRDLLTLATMRSFNFKKGWHIEQKTFDNFVCIQCVLLATT